MFCKRYIFSPMYLLEKIRIGVLISPQNIRNWNWKHGFRIGGLIYRERYHREHRKYKHHLLKSLLKSKNHLSCAAAPMKAWEAILEQPANMKNEHVCLMCGNGVLPHGMSWAEKNGSIALGCYRFRSWTKVQSWHLDENHFSLYRWHKC